MANSSSDDFDFSKLTAEIKDDFTPSLKVCNELPDDWNAVVVDIGIKFIFQNWTDKPNDDVGGKVNLPTDACATFRSRTNSCCAGWFILAKVMIDGKEYLADKAYSVDNATTCFVYDELGLVASSTRGISGTSKIEFRIK